LVEPEPPNTIVDIEHADRLSAVPVIVPDPFDPVPTVTANKILEIPVTTEPVPNSIFINTGLVL
jgi:hypothetical protein